MADKVNVADGVELDEDESGNLRIVQTISLDAVPGVGPVMVYNALQRSVVPRRGATLPGVPGVRVVSRRVRPFGAGGAKVVVTYGTPSSDATAATVGEVSYRVTTQQITQETLEDINGNRMTTRYVGFYAGAFVVASQIHRVQVQKPTFSVVFTRVERGAGLALATTYAFKSNVRTWQGKPPRSWLMSIDSEQVDDDVHRVSYTATYNPETWRAELRQQIGGQNVINATPGNGISYADVYELIDFARLGLPSVL